MKDNFTIKNKLLSTGYIIDNEYLDQYVDLVCNKETTQTAFITQKHHIIPRFFYKTLNISVDNTNENISCLLYRDHILAHYLLSKCSKDFFYKKNNYALNYLCSKNKCSDETLDVFLEKIQASRQFLRDKIDKNKFINFYQHHSIRDTAKEFDINRSLVTEIAKEFGCLKNKARHERGYKLELDKDELFRIYIINNYTLAETANYFNTSKSSIIRKLKQFNINQKKHKHKHDKRCEYSSVKDINKLEFCEYYAIHTLANTANNFNISLDAAKYLIKNFNISKKNKPTFSSISDELFKFYNDNGLKKTLQKFKISKTHFYRLIKNIKN